MNTENAYIDFSIASGIHWDYWLLNNITERMYGSQDGKDSSPLTWNLYGKTGDNMRCQSTPCEEQVRYK